MSKVCLVTGASRGIGRETVQELHARGHKVYAGIRNVASANRELAQEMSNFCSVVELDVTDARQAELAIDKVLQHEGRIDVLVNNAGYAMFGPVEEEPLEDARTLFETNFFGALRMTQLVCPTMRAQGGGVIAQISSISGRCPSPLMGMYAASKHALEAMSEALAYEVGHFGIRVILIEPGNYKTEVRVQRTETLLNETSAYMGLVRTRKAPPDSILKQKDPAECGRAIVNAIEDETCPLRVPVGVDAVELIGKRNSLGDEGYKRYMWDLFGMDW